MQNQNTKKLIDAIVSAPDIRAAVEALPRGTVDSIVIHTAEALRARRSPRFDSRQLDLPGFEHVNVSEYETLEHYRAETHRLELRIKHYDYARRSTANLKRDKDALRERKGLDAKIAAYFASNPNMTVTRAIERYRADLESPAIRQRREAQKGRARRTKNQ